MRPRIRTIKPEIWQDERIGGLSHGARLLFIGLITMADDEGRLRELPPHILGFVFPYDGVSSAKLARWLREVEATGMVVRYEVNGCRYIAFRNWSRHQKVDKPNASILPVPVVDNSTNSPGQVADSSRSLRAGADPIPSDPDPILNNLCDRLAERIRRNDPKADPKPQSRRWQAEMRLLLAERNGDVEEVERIIDWCQSDPFWRSNVLSPGKLRKQFTQLVLKAQAGATVHPIRENASDLLRAINRSHP